MPNLIKSISLTLILLILATSCAERDHGNVIISMDVPNKIDGILNRHEWSAASYYDISEQHRLFIVQNSTDLFIGIRNTDTTARYVDLYIKEIESSPINLHASFAEGERQLTGEWNDTIPPWTWGPFKDWEANTVKSISEDTTVSFKQTLAPYDGYEFKIALSKFKRSRFQLRVEIRDFMGVEKDIVFPPDSDRNMPSTWFQVKL